MATFLAGVIFIHSQKLSLSIQFSCLLFLTMLLRPEAALLYPIISIASVAAAIRHKLSLKPMLIGLIALLALGSVYLTWKYLHFGQLLPNPFYIKASGRDFISSFGLQSIKDFIYDYALLLILAISSLIFAIVSDRPEQRWNKTVVLVGFAFVVEYCLFFAHVDTLMDYGRFLYPLVPLIILLDIPILAKSIGFFEHMSIYKIPVLPGIMVTFLLAFGPSNITRMNIHIKGLITKEHVQTNGFLMQKEYRIAKILAQFPEIRDVKVAFGDSGVIPYFTGALWLDTVGLNDGFIAKTRDKNKLVDYFFDWSPDLVIHPGRARTSWLQDGHGPLGNYLSWSNDSRWDEYQYVGTSNIIDTYYDLQYFVKKSSRFRDPLEGFLKANVVDGWYDPFPLPIGTYHPKGNSAKMVAALTNE